MGVELGAQSAESVRLLPMSHAIWKNGNIMALKLILIVCLAYR